MMQNYGIAGGAAAIAAVAAASATAAPDAFDKSPFNPTNMSRMAASTASTHSAPSAKLLERVRVAAADLAELACVQAGWRYVTEKNGATAYEMNGSVLPSTVSVASTFGNKVGGKASDYYLVKATTTVRADPDRALALLTAATTERFALRMNQLFGRHYENGVLIDHMSCTSPPAQVQGEDGAIQRFTEDDAYAVHWLSLKPGGSSENARDFTFASYQDAFQRDPRGALVRLGRRAVREAAATATATVDPLASSSASVQSSLSASAGPRGGRLLGVHTLTSFNFKDIPELPRHKYTDRLHLRTSGFVVEETAQRGVVRVSLFLSLTPVAATLRSPRKYEKWLQSLAVAVVGNYALQLQKDQARTQTPVQPTANPEIKKVAWKKSDHCALCLKTFHTFRRCHHCRLCGEAVCNKCSGFVDVSKVNVLEALQGRGRPPTPTSSGQEAFAETRGCTRCIQTLMDDMANAHALASGSVCATPNDNRTSTAGSQSSSRTSRLAGSFLNDPHAVHHQYNTQQHPPSPFVVHHYDDDDLSSLDSTSTDGRGYVMNASRHLSSAGDSTSHHLGGDNNGGGSVPMVPIARQRSDDALTMNDLDGYAWSRAVKTLPPSTTPVARFAKPPLDPKSSLSMSTVSTSHSFDDRVSAASHETYGSSHATTNQHQSVSQFKQLTMHPHVRSPEDDEFTPNASAMAIAGLSIHADKVSDHDHHNDNGHDHFDLHDYEADDDASLQFARSMVGNKSAAHNAAPPPSRLTASSTSSGGSGSFKFSMMSNHLSLHSEPENEPNGDSFSGHFYTRSSDHQPRVQHHQHHQHQQHHQHHQQQQHQQHQQHQHHGAPFPSTMQAPPAPLSVASSPSSSSKLFAASAGPRLHSQQYPSRPPRPQPSSSSSTFHNDRARSSSSSSSVASLRLANHEDMMIPLPAAAMAALGGNISAKNDMILLAPTAPPSPKFIEFSDARRESICARPGDGSDMIPLHF